MTRVNGLAVVMLMLAACVDFDAKYAEAMARLADAGASHSDLDAGVDASVDAGPPDAGPKDGGLEHCTELLCPYASWVGATGTWTVDTYFATSGIVMTSFREVVVSGSRNSGKVGSSDVFNHFFVAIDEGRATTTNVTAQFSVRESSAIVGVPADFWLADKVWGRHFIRPDGGVRFATTERIQGCGEAIWGMSPTSVGLLTTGLSSVCLVHGDGGESQLCPALPELATVYFNAAWALPSGAVLAAGGNYDGVTQTVGHMWVLDAGRANFPPFPDPDGYGFVALGGVGDDVWAATRLGQIMHRSADGGAFVVEHSTNMPLRDLFVASATDIWAVGLNSSFAAHFNGTRWADVPLPDSTEPLVVWEHVRADDGGLVLSGSVSYPDGGVAAIARIYRRGQ